MRISASDTVAGYPILRIRNLLKRGQLGDIVVDDVERLLHVDQPEARRVLAMLEQEGYVERITRFAPHEQWATTLKGNTLAMASAAPPTTRAKATQRLAEFLQRVEQVNADARYVYRVKEVVVFGSYLGESPTVNDIDLAIALEPRFIDETAMLERSEQRVREALDAGRRFHSGIEEILWPYNEVIFFLKQRSHLISLHELKDVEELKTTFRVLYREGQFLS